MTSKPNSASGATVRTDVAEPAQPQGAEPGPFVLNLCSSTTPMALARAEQPELQRFSFFVSRRFEEGRERFRLHMGYFATLAEAEEWLGAVRDIYPGAWAGEAPGKKLRERATAAAAEQARHAAGPPPAAGSVRAAPAVPPPRNIPTLAVADPVAELPPAGLSVPTLRPAVPAVARAGIRISAPIAAPPAARGKTLPAAVAQAPAQVTPVQTRPAPAPTQVRAAARATSSDQGSAVRAPAQKIPTPAQKITTPAQKVTAPTRTTAAVNAGASLPARPAQVEARTPTRAMLSGAAPAGAGRSVTADQQAKSPSRPAATVADSRPMTAPKTPVAGNAPKSAAPSLPAGSRGKPARPALPNSNVREVLAALDEDTGETRMMPAAKIPAVAAVDDSSFTDTQVLRLLETRRSDTGDGDINDESGSISLLKPDDTGTRRALKEAVSQNAPVWFAVQLQWSVQPVELSKVPPLAIFSAYTLYTVEGSRDGRKWYGLRLGFFSDAISAKQVAYYVRSEFNSVAVVPVSPQEHDRASDGDRKGAGHLAFPKKTRSGPVEEFKLIDSDATPPSVAAAVPPPPRPGTAADRRAAVEARRARMAGQVRARDKRAPQTLEETLEILGASQLEIDDGRGETLNDSGVRHLRVEVQKNTPFSRLLERLSERVRKP
ncbi:MAG TPA: hypothetical protein VLX90_05985 [Steroidobacteraceae bacterium]|nr:hypothetical protein [Steroidobacteraceae bacterium]